LTLTDIHHNLATSVLLFMLIAGVWGIISYARGRSMSGNYWGILAVGELLILAQGVLGAVLWISGARPGRLGIHVLYGVVAVISLPAYYAITRGRDDRQIVLVYGLLNFFLAAISLRAAATVV
jgi:uncharacterized membrane protein